MELKPGIKIHGYTLKEFISSGATAEVWKIMDEYGNEKALKIFSPVQKVDDATLDLLIDEFKMLYRLDHPHILKSEIMGAYQKVPYIIMPYYTGSLSVEMTMRAREAQTASRLFSPWFSEDECLTLLQQIGGGLAYLHDQGILHQDVKPENILFNTYSDQVQYVLTDFGISTRIKENIARMTMPRHQSYALTPAYASPEQFSGKQDFKSDVFSLGVVIFEMCEGRLPYTKQGYVSNNYGNTVRPEFRNSNLSDPFKHLILKALSENPNNRPEAKEFELHAIRSRGNTITEVDGADLRSHKITVLQPVRNPSHGSGSYPPSLNEYPDDSFHSPTIKSSNQTKLPTPQMSSRRSLGKAWVIGFVILLIAAFLGKEYADKRTYTANILAGGYDEINPFYENRALVRKDGKWGYIDDKGKIIIPLIYTFGSNFEKGVAFVCKSKDECGVINLKEVELTDFIYTGCLILNEKSGTLSRIKDGHKSNENVKFKNE